MNECTRVSASELASHVPSRLPGVGYWFSEDSSFAFGLMVNLSELWVAYFDGDALYERFHSRLTTEFEQLMVQVDATRTEGSDVYPVDPEEDVPLSISMPVEDTIFLKVVPAALSRETFSEKLPGMLREFIAMMADPFPNAI